MQKTAALTLALALLFSVVTVAICANLAKANPAPLFSFPTAPVTTSPTITITSPLQDQTYNSTNEWLNISIVKPESWFAINVFHHEDHTPGSQTFVNITSVYYVLDTGERQNITVHDVDDLFDVAPVLTLNLSTMLPLTTPLTTVDHSIKVGLEADSYYVARYVYNLYEALSSIKLTAETDAVNFTVTKPGPPTISGLSISNKTYDSRSIPLNFYVDKKISWLAYDLDNQGNATILGNTTLTELSNGPHSIVVYANDTMGNMGLSDTIYFTIEVPFPFDIVITAFVTSALVIAVGLLVYYKRRNAKAGDKP